MKDDTEEPLDKSVAADLKAMQTARTANEKSDAASELASKANQMQTVANALSASAANMALNEKSGGSGRDWGEVGRGTGGMLKGGVQIIVGAAVTQGDTVVPGPLDIVGAAIVVEGIGDVALNYGIALGGLTGTDTSDIPDDFANAAVDVITGKDEAGAAAQQIFDAGVDGFKETM